MGAQQFLCWLLRTSAALGSALYAFILILDPYQDVPFSPPLPRAPISTNQRFSYAALARDRTFDSAIIGDSTVRLLDPERLSKLLDAHFVSLAMNSATAYEQSRVHGLFADHHAQARYLVIGVDGTWCTRETTPNYTFRTFPEWLYDDDRWNDLLYLFNDKALEDAVRMLELVRGQRAPRYRRDGYADFTTGFGPYDLARAQRRIYADAPPPLPAQQPLPPTTEHPTWRFPQIDALALMLAHSPAGARVVLVFVPLHARVITQQAEVLAECKGRLLQHFAGDAGVTLLDYMWVSELTRTDSNYWDSLHYTDTVARQLELDIAAVLKGQAPPSGYGHMLAAVRQPAP